MDIKELHKLEAKATAKLGTARQEHSSYNVIPLKSAEGRATAWLHNYVHRNWDFFTYNAYSNAWVTDAENGGNPINVDTIEAHLGFSPGDYPSGTDTRHNTYFARSELTFTGVGVPNPRVCGYGHAVDRTYGDWRNPEGCF